MVDIEIEKCITVLNRTLAKKFSTKKTARVVKSELDNVFKKELFKFSVVVSSDSRDVLGKSLYGLWISLTGGGKHYLLIASYPIVKGKKITEAQMDRIEDWTSTYFIKYENITDNSSKFEKVTKSLKWKLDQNYGKGNTWAVIVFRQQINIKAKELEDNRYAIEFARLRSSHWLIFRAGEDITFEEDFMNIFTLNNTSFDTIYKSSDFDTVHNSSDFDTVYNSSNFDTVYNSSNFDTVYNSSDHFE